MCDYAKIPLPKNQQRDFVLNIQAYLNVFPAVHTVLCGIGIQVSHGILFCESKLSKFGISTMVVESVITFAFLSEGRE